MAVNMSMPPMGKRAPYLSQTGPRRKRKKMGPETETIFDVHACCLLRLSDILTSDMSGARANQEKNAQKNVIHDQWKARMCGRFAVKSLISVALSFCLGSTLQS